MASVIVHTISTKDSEAWKTELARLLDVASGHVSHGENVQYILDLMVKATREFDAEMESIQKQLTECKENHTSVLTKLIEALVEELNK